MTDQDRIKSILLKSFNSAHINAALSHFVEAVTKYNEGDWEKSILRTGKLVEAVTKMLWLHCGQTLPPARKFQAGTLLRNLEKLSDFDDTIRLTIPRVALSIYDIASNRGARHDPDEIDSNEMDANFVIPAASWILAELIRFADSGASSHSDAEILVKKLSAKKYPYFENIDGRSYVNIKGLGARITGLLILNSVYPDRMSRKKLIELVARHGFSKKNAEVSIYSLLNVIDYDSKGEWLLRGLGRQEAETIESKLKPI